MDTDPLIPDEDTSPFDDYGRGAIDSWRAGVRAIVEVALLSDEFDVGASVV